MFDPDDRTIHNPHATTIMVAVGVGIVNIFSAVYAAFVFVQWFGVQLSGFTRRIGLFEPARKK